MSYEYSREFFPWQTFPRLFQFRILWVYMYQYLLTLSEISMFRYLYPASTVQLENVRRGEIQNVVKYKNKLCMNCRPKIFLNLGKKE